MTPEIATCWVGRKLAKLLFAKKITTFWQVPTYAEVKWHLVAVRAVGALHSTCFEEIARRKNP